MPIFKTTQRQKMPRGLSSQPPSREATCPLSHGTQPAASFRHGSGWLVGHIWERSRKHQPHLPMPLYRGTVSPCAERFLIGWLWGGDPAAAADPQRTAVATHLTRSHLSHGSRQQTSPRVDLQSPMASSSRSFWPRPRRLWLASGSALSAVFEQQVSVQPGFLGSPDESVGPSLPSYDRRWARI